MDVQQNVVRTGCNVGDFFPYEIDSPFMVVDNDSLHGIMAPFIWIVKEETLPAVVIGADGVIFTPTPLCGLLNNFL
jgi:hypothetical protein